MARLNDVRFLCHVLSFLMIPKLGYSRLVAFRALRRAGGQAGGQAGKAEGPVLSLSHAHTHTLSLSLSTQI